MRKSIFFGLLLLSVLGTMMAGGFDWDDNKKQTGGKSYGKKSHGKSYGHGHKEKSYGHGHKEESYGKKSYGKKSYGKKSYGKKSNGHSHGKKSYGHGHTHEKKSYGHGHGHGNGHGHEHKEKSSTKKKVGGKKKISYNGGNAEKYAKGKHYYKQWKNTGKKYSGKKLKLRKRYQNIKAKKGGKRKRSSTNLNINKSKNKHSSLKSDFQKHSVSKFNNSDKHHKKHSKYFKHFKQSKIEYTIRKRFSDFSKVKYLGKFCKFGKFSKVRKTFGFCFKFTKCYKHLNEYKKMFSKYQKTHKSVDLAKAKVFYSKFCNCGVVSKKAWIAYEKRCFPKYQVYQSYYNDYLKTRSSSSKNMAHKNFDDFCNCSKGYYGATKWNQYKPHIKYGCTGLFKEGKCSYH